MRVCKLVFVVIIASITINAQQYQYQPYPYPFPNYTPQNEPLYEQAPQQQIPYYTQMPQQSTYYPVNQQIQQQPMFYPAATSQPAYYPYPYQYGGWGQQQLQPEQLQQQQLQQLPEQLQQQQLQQLPEQQQQQLQPLPLLPEQMLSLPQQKQIQGKPDPLGVTPDTYANVKTEIIDIKPEDFRRVIQQLHVQPIIVSYENRVVRGRSKHPIYVVTAESNQSNKTKIPSNIQNFQTTSKVYTFNKTFVLHPGDHKNSVVNLNFVNGVQVTDPPKAEDGNRDETTTVRTTTEPPPTTTTENEEPAPILDWLN